MSCLKMAGEADSPSQTVTEAASECHAHCKDGDGIETSIDNDNVADDNDPMEGRTIEFADDLTERGRNALKEKNFSESVDCFSRALEIRVTHYGELAPECMNAYYLYGTALLYKAQEEAEPIGAEPKKDTFNIEASCAASVASAASASNSVKDEITNHPQVVSNDEESGASEDEEDLAEPEDDESDLDMAWKMLDIARAICEKQGTDTIEMVEILSSLAEVALEREDVETALADNRKALAILEKLVEPDSRRFADLFFRICLCLEFGYKIDEATGYCQKALAICNSRMQRLKNESPEAEVIAEIEILSGLSEELEKKLEDLQQANLNPRTIVSDMLASMKCNRMERATNTSQLGTENSGGYDSPTASTAHTNGVTHLGVVGRGVKRVLMTPESTPPKKPAVQVLNGE